MTITPVATGAPTDVRQSVEQNTYALLQQLSDQLSGCEI